MDARRLGTEAFFRIVAWCRDLGATEFTLDVQGTNIDPRELWRRVQEILKPFERAEAERDRPTGYDLWKRESVSLYSLSPESIDALATTGINVHFEPPQSPRYVRTESGFQALPFECPHFLCLYRDKEPLLWLDEEQYVEVHLHLDEGEFESFLAAGLVPVGQYVVTDLAM